MIASISVVIPTYNRAHTIARCLRSVVQQTLPPMEVIVVDDCSSDNTVSMVQGLGYPSVRVVVLEQNSGAQAARNRGIREAHGEWIAFQDSDDEWIKNKLEIQYHYNLTNGLNVSYTNAWIHKDQSRWLYDMPDYSMDTYKCLLAKYGPMFPSLLVRRQCLVEIGFLDECVPSYQEWDTSIRLARRNNFGFINQPLFVYHLHQGETISKDVAREALGVSYIAQKHREEIVRVAGAAVYRRHCLDIAERFRRAGNPARERAFLKDSVRFQEGFARRCAERLLLLYCPLFRMYLEQGESFPRLWARMIVKTKMFIARIIGRYEDHNP